MIGRGVHGWDEPVFGTLAIPETVIDDKGEERTIYKKFTGIVGTKKMFSDRMLEMALKSRRPGKFKDRIEHTGADGGPIETKVTRIERVIVDGPNTTNSDAPQVSPAAPTE